jgi:cysteine synthase B
MRRASLYAAQNFLHSSFMFEHTELISPRRASLMRRPLAKSKSLFSSPAKNVFALVGNTPMLNLSRYSPKSTVKILAKVEWANPGHSVKDRAASRIIRKALQRGELTRERILLDSTSGNTGLAYALFGAALGIRVRLAVPENVSPLQKNLLRAYGADVVWTSAQEGSDGAIRIARTIFAENPQRCYYADQYSNAENWKAHYHATAPEIWRQTAGRITHFVAGLGTTGTFVGASRRLLEYNSSIRVLSFQPDSPFHGLEGLKHLPTALVPAIYDATLADGNLEIATEPAQHWVRELARREGYLIGLSSGAALEACRQVAAQIESGVIVTIFPDGGYRYLEDSFWL